MSESGKLILELIFTHYWPFSIQLNEYGISNIKETQSGQSNGFIKFSDLKDITVMLMFRVVIALICVLTYWAILMSQSENMFNYADNHKRERDKRYQFYVVCYVIVISIFGFLWFITCLKKQ